MLSLPCKTLELFINLSSFILGAAFKEALLKPALKITYRKAFILLPELFDKLDPIMPENIAKLSPEEMSYLIKQKIEDLIGEKEVKLSDKEKDKLFEEFVIRYNPVIASSKVNG